MKWGCAREWGGWGRLSDDGPGQQNPDRSEGSGDSSSLVTPIPNTATADFISLFAEVYAATGQTAGPTVAEVDKPHTAQFVEGIERSVVTPYSGLKPA